MSKRKAPTDSTNPNHDFCEFLTGKLLVAVATTMYIN